MAGRQSERFKKTKDQKSLVGLGGLGVDEPLDSLASFALPESLSCSEVDFPILLRKKSLAAWDDIVQNEDERIKEFEEFVESKKEPILKSPFLKTECDFITAEIYPHLLPALEETLNKAKLWQALVQQKCFFNGVDHIAQLLWQNNPRHPYRKHYNQHIFNMPWARQHLRECPRPYYPKSWLWPEEYAATLIQKTVRQYFVQREEDVQEMRDFWKKLKFEKKHPDIHTNPILARKFAEYKGGSPRVKDDL